jgi:hypothetical protein
MCRKIVFIFLGDLNRRLDGPEGIEFVYNVNL